MRRSDEADKRIYGVFLTKSGRAMQEELTPIVLNHRRFIFEGLKPDDLQAARNLLKHIVKNLEKSVPQRTNEG